MRSLLAAVGFLTRIPVPAGTLSERALTRSVLWYPTVGLLVGGICSLAYCVLIELWPGVTAALLVMVLLVGLKDAFHLDGLGDFVDGLAGGSDPVSRYDVMQDGAIGVMGTLAVIGCLGVEAAVLVTLSPPEVQRVLLLGPTLSTSAGGLLLCLGTPRPDETGLGARLSGRTTRGYSTVLLVASLLLVVAVDPVLGPLLWGGMVVFPPLFARLTGWSTEGVTGDACGSLVMVSQAGLLLVAQAWIHAGGPSGW